MNDPWNQLLGAEPATAIDPFDQWDVDWEDVSQPIETAVTITERIASAEINVDGQSCANCGRPLTRDTWTLEPFNGRQTLVCAPHLLRTCYLDA